MQTPRLINMGLRSEEAAAVGDAEFWVGFENCHVVQDHCKSFSRFNFLCSPCVASHVPPAAADAGILRADTMYVYTWQPGQAELIDSIFKPVFKHSNHSLYIASLNTQTSNVIQT